MDMAAAMMKQEQIQKVAEQSRSWEYDSDKNSSWSGPSSQPDGKVHEYKGNKTGFEAAQEIGADMRAGKYKPGDIVKRGEDYLQYHPELKDGDWPFLPVRKRSKQEDLTS